MEERDGRVVVGVAGSMAGLQALRHAVDEARRRGVELHAIHAWQFPQGWRGPEAQRLRRGIADEAAVVLRKTFQAAMGGVPTDVVVRLVVVEGAPHRVLVGYANLEDDLLVLGARRHRLFPIGIDQYCRRHAGCPVLIVPPSEPASAGGPEALARKLQREAEEFVYTMGTVEMPGR